MKQTTLALINKCTAHICLKGNRIKEYTDKVYLKNGQEFEIELNNYTQDVIGAKILMNGKAISDALIIIKPGQRVLLDRYLDVNKKFLFETYEVGNTVEAQKAIELNGDVEVRFFKEKKYTPPQPIYRHPTYDFFSNGTGNYSQTISANSFNCCTTDSATREYASKGISNQPIETGRIEQGSVSNQKFGNYSGDFESHYFMSSRIKIVPFQYKPLTMNDLTEYCTNCGTKNRKGNYKFCPKCGTKY